MKRVFFEKDPKKDFLFIISEPNDSSEIYRVRNFTDETGHEYVYTLIGERKILTDEILNNNVSSLAEGKYINYNGEGGLSSAKECIESMLDFRNLNKENDIYIYVRNK